MRIQPEESEVAVEQTPGPASPKSIALKTSVFLALLVALDFTVGTALKTMLANLSRGDVTGEINRILEQRDVDLLVFGTSRAVLHVDTPRIARRAGIATFNAGSQGRGIYYARMLQALMLRRESQAKIVLLQAEPGDLFAPRPERAQLFAPYVDESREIARILGSRDTFASLRLTSRVYRFNSLMPSMLRAMIGPPPQAYDRGFRPWHHTLSEEKMAMPSNPAAVLDQGSGDRPLPEAAALYGEFVAAALEAGQHVLLFTGPRLRAAPQDERERRAIEVFEGVAAKHGVPYREWSERDLPELARREFFADRQHLNAAGSARFSDHLLGELYRLGWLEGSPRQAEATQ